MIAPLSFLAAFDVPQAKPKSGEAEALESTGNSGIDGFAALIAQLIQVPPTSDEPIAAAAAPAETETGNLPSGKILPDGGDNFAVATATQGRIGSEAQGNPALVPIAATLKTSSATIISFQQAQTALVAKRIEPIAQGTPVTEPSKSVVRDGAIAPKAPPAFNADQIRMTVSIAPVQTTELRAAASQNPAIPVEKQLSAALVFTAKTTSEPAAIPMQPLLRAAVPEDSSAPVEKPFSAATASVVKAGPETAATPAQPRSIATPIQPGSTIREDSVSSSAAPVIATLSAEVKPQSREPQLSPTVIPDRTRSVAAASIEQDAASGERSGQAAIESPAAPARSLASSDGVKPFATPLVAPIEAAAANRGDGNRIAAATPVSALSSVEGIERLVERLSVAREFDMTKPASIAVAHREFGALTVTFDNGRNGLDVEVSAKDADMQRALALAVAADRPTGRTGEPLQQSLPQTSQANSTASDRGTSTPGQGANSSGTASSDGSEQGERSQHQRDRQLASSAQDPRNPARSVPGDDALYA